MPRTSLTVAALAATLAASPAFAQDRTGTGGGAATTATAPNTSSVGQTKPPSGNASAATADAPRDARTRQQVEDDKISRGICIGCGPK